MSHHTASSRGKWPIHHALRTTLAPEQSVPVSPIRSGHGFEGVHGATDTFCMWRPYLELMGGYFNDHPWHQNMTVKVQDPGNPIVSNWGSSPFQINDEIYQISDFQYRDSQVLPKKCYSTASIWRWGV